MDDDTTGKTPEESAGQPPGESAAEPAAGPEAGAETGETSVTPPAGEGATQVMSGESAAATRVLPAAGEAPPPPPPHRPAPTLMMSRPPRRKGSNAWWIILLVIVLAAAAAAAVWFFVLDSDQSEPEPSPAPSVSGDWAGAWARADGAGGGLIIQGDGDQFTVTLYDGGLHPLGVAGATAAGDDLTFTLNTDLGNLTGPLTVTLTFGETTDAAQMTVDATNQNGVTIGLTRVSSLLPASPTASPSPSPTVTPSPTGSPSPSGSPSAAADQQVIDGLAKIQVGVITWATNNNNLYPVAANVVQTGTVAQYVSPWPTNPYTDLPMKPGTEPGDYTYEQINGGAAYKLTAYLSNGLTYTLP